MAKIFILEDDPQRIKIFKIKLIQHELFFTDNVKEAKDMFDLLGPFDYIFLDHDLGGQIYVDSDNHNTGYQFAKYISKKDLSLVQKIVVHSLNENGARKMVALLPNSIYIPFTQLKDSLNG